jgi:hypothetical protein
LAGIGDDTDSLDFQNSHARPVRKGEPVRGYFKPTAVQRLFDEHLRGYRDHSGPIWPLLMLELWHRNFLEKVPDFSRIPSLVGARR